jgi:hypothetical protein
MTSEHPGDALSRLFSGPVFSRPRKSLDAAILPAGVRIKGGEGCWMLEGVYIYLRIASTLAPMY